jgi:CRP-like cAMP-binding protein
MANNTNKPDEVSTGPKKTIADLFDGCPYSHFPARHMIYYREDKIERLYYIISGYVRMYNITDKGNERTLAILGPGESMPLIQTEIAQYFYDAFTEVEAVYSTYDELIERFLADEDYMAVARNSGVRLMQRMLEQMEVMATDTASGKVELALKFLAKYYGEHHSGYTQIKFRITHQELANLVNLTRETVSSTINKLEKSGTIKLGDNGTIEIPDETKPSGATKVKKIRLGNTLSQYRLAKKPT